MLYGIAFAAGFCFGWWFGVWADNQDVVTPTRKIMWRQTKRVVKELLPEKVAEERERSKWSND